MKINSFFILLILIVGLVISMDIVYTCTTTTSTSTTTTVEKNNIDMYLKSEGKCINEEVLIRAETIKGRPINKVNIRIFFNGSKIAYGQTDSKGIFTFTPKDVGKHMITAGKTDFNTANISVDVVDCSPATTSTTSSTTTSTTTTVEKKKADIYLKSKRNCINEEVLIRAETIKGYPLGNVNIKIFFNGSKIAYGQTDSKGIFTFTPKDVGKHMITAGKTDFNTANTRVDVVDCRTGMDGRAVLVVRVRTDKNEIYPGDKFYVMADIGVKDGDSNGVGATIEVPEGFDVDNTTIIIEELIEEGGERTLTWCVKSSNSTPEGEYSFTVTGFDVDYRGEVETHTNKVYVKSRMEPSPEGDTGDGVVKTIHEGIYGFTEKVYESASNIPSWIIPLLLLLALVYIYHVGSRIYYAKEREIGRMKENKEEEKIEGG